MRRATQDHPKPTHYPPPHEVARSEPDKVEVARSEPDKVVFAKLCLWSTLTTGPHHSESFKVAPYYYVIDMLDGAVASGETLLTSFMHELLWGLSELT